MRCLACKNMSLQHTPAMARLGFGHCKCESRNYVHVSVSWDRECGKFDQVTPETLGKRSDWLNKQQGD